MRAREAAAAAALLFGVLPAAAAAQAVAFAGSDRVRLELPAGGLVEAYSNTGYHLEVSGGMATVEVDLSPLRSRQPFVMPTSPNGSEKTGGGGEAIEVLARAVAAGATTRYDAVTRVLQWVARNIAYDLDRAQPQSAAAVLLRRSGYCTGIARLSVALLQPLGIPAREVPGFLVAPAGGGAASSAGSRAPAGFHRWIEVHYDDVGWVFSDPLLALHYVPATYVRLASEALLPEAESLPGRLLARDDRRVAVDLFAESSPHLTVRRNGVVRRAAALQVTVGGATAGRAVLEGEGTRRVRALDRGESTFVGLEPGSYLLRVEVDGASPSLKRVILRDRVWGAVHLPAPAALEPLPPAPGVSSSAPISEEEST